MAVSFGAIGSRTNKAAVATTDTITPALPSGVAAGDRLVIFASSLRDATTFSADQSYVKTRQNTKIAILEKNAGASEVAPTVTFGGLTVGDLISAVVLRFPGGAATKDWSNVTGASSATSMPGPPLTVTDAGSVGVVIGYQPNDKTGSVFTANGWTEREYTFTTTGSDGTHYIATQDGLAAGSQTMPSWAWSGGLEYRAISFTVPPAASGSTTPQTVTVTSASSVSLGKASAKAVSAVSTSLLMVSKLPARAISAVVGSVSGVAKITSKAVAASVLSVAGTTASRAFLVAINASIGASVAILRNTAHTVAVASSASVYVRKLVGATVGSLVATTASAAKSVGSRIAVSAASILSVTRSIPVVLAVTSVAAVGRLISVGRNINISAPTAVVFGRMISISINSTAVSLASIVGQFRSGLFELSQRTVRVIAQVRLAMVGKQNRLASVIRDTRAASVAAEKRVVSANR